MNSKYLTRFVMQSAIAGLAIAFLVVLIWPELVNTGNHGSTGNNTDSYNIAVSKAAPAVVNVYASRVFEEKTNPLFQDPLFQRFFGPPQPPGKRRDSSLGSGVIMNGDGYILTNAHVISNKTDIQVTLPDGRAANAEVIGIDTDTDLAVLHISLDKLPVIVRGNSDELHVGDVVLAIGNPYDFGQTVTQGIVSAKGRKRMGITTFEDFIQTDADINPGNSGGALITANGELVGINTAIITNSGGSQGIGLATPVNQAVDVMNQIIENGRVVRGWLGIEAQIVPPDILRDAGIEQGGVMVAGVLRNGPADRAGMIPGDIILRIGDQAVSDPQEAIERIARMQPGKTIRLLVLRGWKEMQMTAQVALRPSFIQPGTSQ